MFPHWVTKLLQYYDLFGFCTELKASHRYQLYVRSIVTVHIILVFIVTFVMVHYVEDIAVDALGAANDIVKYGGALLVYWSSVIESCLKCRTKRKLWKIYQSIDEHHCSHRGLRKRNYLLKFITYFSAMAYIYLSYLLQVIDFAGSSYIVFWFSYVALMIMYQNRAFYYLFHLELIKSELDMIGKEIDKIVQSFRMNGHNQNRYYGRNSMFETFERKRLKWIREYYGLVGELSECLNSVFGWSNLATILFSFQIILTDLNWIYWKLYNKQQIYAISGDIMNWQSLFKSNYVLIPFSDYAIWIGHLTLIIFYIFRLTTACFVSVMTPK